MFGLGRQVKVVNRVRKEDGSPVPFEARWGGEAFWIKDSMDLPYDVARTVIHQSMYKIDPVTSLPDYRLGCEELGTATSALTVETVTRVELLERELMSPNLQKIKTVKLHNPIMPRRDAHRPAVRESTDGAQPGMYGDQRS
jgi:hypothetical protein